LLSSLILILSLCAAQNATDDGTSGPGIVVVPKMFGPLFMGTKHTLQLNVSFPFTKDAKIRLRSQDEIVAVVTDMVPILVNEDCGEECNIEIEFAVEAKILGRAGLELVVEGPCDAAAWDPEDRSQIAKYEKVLPLDTTVLVFRERTTHLKIFIMITSAWIAVLMFGFGCQIELKTLVLILKKPIPPFIGFCCQFGLLPLIGIGLTFLLRLEPAFGFGLLVYSCCPGGSLSNVFALMLDGDLTLSLIMTFCSTIMALGMMPLWIFIMSRTTDFMDDDVAIPYIEIVKTLLLLVVPCLIGVAFNKWKPTWAQKVIASSKYVSIVFVLFQQVGNVWLNYYMFQVIAAYPRIIGAIALLPPLGFFGGYGLSKLSRQPHPQAITIALETSIQNIAIAIIMLLTTFGLPEGDLGAVLPIMAGYVTTAPLLLFLIGMRIYACISKQEEPQYEPPKAIEPADQEFEVMVVSDKEQELNGDAPKPAEEANTALQETSNGAADPKV